MAVKVKFEKKKKNLMIVFLVFISIFTLYYWVWDEFKMLFEDRCFGRCTARKIPININNLDRDCNCRRIDKGFVGDGHHGNHYCSEYTTSRGPNQKVISFSLYGDSKSSYFDGIKANLEGVKQYYPGYIMRLYHDQKAPIQNTDAGKALCELYCKEPSFDLCNVHYIDWYRNLPAYFGMLWRFTPMADPLVREWHSRDLDSRISEREIAAVKDWNDSGKTYHIMRDNPRHSSYIMGGGFGMKKISTNAADMKNDFEMILLGSHMVWKKTLDQKLLNKYIWPKAKYDMIAHDSYLCNSWFFSYPGNRPWPSKRLEGEGVWNFVGSNGGTISLKVHGECPQKCRPKDHKDWVLC